MNTQRVRMQELFSLPRLDLTSGLRQKLGTIVALMAAASLALAPVAQAMAKGESDPPAPQSAPQSDVQAAPQSTKVNINTASLAELDTLPGIGPALAQKIVDARPYAKIEDIQKVSGIGPKTFDKLKDLITVN